ncbi:MAG: hypothetical protein Q9227_005968 [Pyrenula ochraceoflavens]
MNHTDTHTSIAAEKGALEMTEPTGYDSNVEKDQTDFHHIDPIAEKRLMRKVDWRLIPILALLFLCAFVDRINIGNARIQGLEKDLKMKGNNYNVALFIFFIPYILLEVPSNMILKKTRPSIWLSSIMFGWAIITICQGVTQSYAGLCRYELQFKFNLFFSASILAGAFSGLLAYAIANMKGVAGYNGWRWIFIIEGLVTAVIAACSYFIIPDWPETARFLTASEKHLLLTRLHLDSGHGTMNTWNRRAARRTFSDPKIWLGVLMYFGIVNTGYSGSFFTPTILKQLGWTSIHAQVMSIPIYIVATVLALSVALLTDRLHHRFTFTIIGCCITTVGYAILLNMKHVPVGARYFALYAITGGGYITQPITIAWLNNNMGG